MTTDIVGFYRRWSDYTTALVDGMTPEATPILKARLIHREAWRLLEACSDAMEAEHDDDDADENLDAVDGADCGSCFIVDECSPERAATCTRSPWSRCDTGA